MKPIEIHRRMKVQYGDACLSLQQVYEWTGKFMNVISSVTDCPRPGQAHPVVTPEGNAAVEDIVKENRRLTVNEIARISGYESRISTPYRPLCSADIRVTCFIGDKKYLRFSFDSPSYKHLNYY